MFDQSTNHPQISTHPAEAQPSELLNRQALSRFLIGRILFDGASQVAWGWLMLCVLGASTFLPAILRGTQSPRGLLVVMPHFLAGLLMAFLYAKSNINTLKLLRHGKMTIGRFRHKHHKRLNKGYVYQYAFNININGQKYQPTIKHKHDYDFQDQDEMLIFYNPTNPMDAVVFELMPGNLYINSRNSITMDISWNNIKYFIMPLISMLGIPVLLVFEKYLNQTKIQLLSATPEQHIDNTTHLLASKERSISLLTAIRVLFGGLAHELGWALLAFSLPFILVFVSPKNIKGLVFQASSKSETVGIVESVNQTNITQNKRRVYAIQFQYEFNDRIYRNESYSTSLYLPKQAVNIEYRVNKPSDARIRGTDFSNGIGASWAIIILLIFPTTGLTLIVRSLKKTIIARNLLTSGTSVIGKYKERVATNVTIGNKPIYKLIYQFTAQDGNSYTAECIDETMTKHKEEAVILYNPTLPSQAIIFDGVPGKLIINEQGHIVSSQRWHRIQVLIGPILSIGEITLIIAMIMRGLS